MLRISPNQRTLRGGGQNRRRPTRLVITHPRVVLTLRVQCLSLLPPMRISYLLQVKEPSFQSIYSRTDDDIALLFISSMMPIAHKVWEKKFHLQGSVALARSSTPCGNLSNSSLKISFQSVDTTLSLGGTILIVIVALLF